MSQIVVDTGVASYLFNWHSSARHYVDALGGFELVLVTSPQRLPERYWTFFPPR